MNDVGELIDMCLISEELFFFKVFYLFFVDIA
jgi:hypothetical protein